MVLASNEWQNNSDDDQKTATSNSTTSTATTVTTASSTTSTAATVTSVITSATDATSDTTITNAADTPVQTVTEVNPKITTEVADTIRDNADIDGNTLHSAIASLEFETFLKEQLREADGEVQNNNQDSLINKWIDEANLKSNPDSNFNSGTNTLQSSSIGRQGISTNDSNIAAEILSSPITAQALSAALQSALGTNIGDSNDQTVSNEFLSSLGIDISSSNDLIDSQPDNEISGSANNSSSDGSSIVNVLPSVSQPSPGMSMEFGQAKIILLCEANSHPFQTRTILLTPNIECKVGRLIAKSKASESNAIFDCKVLSRNHAVLWYSDDGKFWVKDTKSSNGTFINDQKLGNEAAELHFGDIVKFGVDVLENLRKEVHGCIIACVKLYYPDGREAVSIDSNPHRSQYSGESKISYDEMHRLSMYMQETAQRERVLKSKLFSIQNTLDATRKNSSLCWQSMVTEDQLIHRINFLEKKLQVSEKNLPESALRNEVIKLLDDKNSYQHTAKEALRKVYQERCDAMQMLAKMEAAYTTSDNECKLLREQIMSTKQTLQEMNTRHVALEGEYVEYREQTERRLHEAKQENEQNAKSLQERLKIREMECEELKSKISELLIKRADMLEDEEALQKQAIDKLDAAIADMDLGADDDDEEDDDDDDEIEEDDEDGNEGHKKLTAIKDSQEIVCKKKSRKKMKQVFDEFAAPEMKQKVIKKSTIMKWLQNSDLNQNEGSLEIFKAMCNESDSSEEPDASNYINNGAGTIDLVESIAIRNKLLAVCSTFDDKLKSVQKNIIELEEDMESNTNENGEIIENNEKCVNEKEADEVLSKTKRNFSLLKQSLCILREAFVELQDNIFNQAEKSEATKDISPPPAITVQTQFQNYALNRSGNSAAKKLETQNTLKLEEISMTEVETDNASTDDDQSKFDSSSCRTVRESNVALQSAREKQQQLEQDIHEYQEQIKLITEKFDRLEMESQQTLDIMQTECDSYKDKVTELLGQIDALKDEKSALVVISENKSNDAKTAESQSSQGKTRNENETELLAEPESENIRNQKLGNKRKGDSFDRLVFEELETINSGAVQREEELIVYKERFEESQNQLLLLQKEVSDLRSHGHSTNLSKILLPCSVIAVAFIVYFLTTYF